MNEELKGVKNLAIEILMDRIRRGELEYYQPEERAARAVEDAFKAMNQINKQLVGKG